VTLADINWQRGALAEATGYAKEALRLRRDLPQPNTFGLALEHLVWFAAAEADHVRVAVLSGALDHGSRLLDSAVSRTLEADPAHGEARARAREALGEARYRAAFQRGAAFTLDEIFGYTLGDRPQPKDANTTLTAREQQVAELIAQGFSNRQIASKLAIAQRTVETHIEHVMRKLTVTSRAQIAVWAAQQGV
jgi:non-specific serine/threonine protein kinase